MTPEQERQLAELWAAREAAAKRVRKTASERVFGAQEQTLREQIERQNELIAANAKAIAALSEFTRSGGERLQRGAERGRDQLAEQIAALRAAVASIPRQIAHGSK